MLKIQAGEQEKSEIYIYIIYNMLREGVPKSNGIWEKRIQVVVTSGVRDKVRQGMLLSSDCV